MQIVPGKKDGETNVYISAAFPHFPCPRDDDRFPETAHEIFELGLKTNPKGDCLGRRLWDEGKGDWANEFTWESYEEVAERRTRVGSGLMKLWEDGIGATERVQWNVGVWCPNQPGTLSSKVGDSIADSAQQNGNTLLSLARRILSATSRSVRRCISSLTL